MIELVTRLVTKERIINLEDPEESKDLIMALVLDRLGSGKAFMGLLKGFGLQRGAYGSTMCWDVTDMIIVGCDIQSMKTVIERLKEIGGGGVYAIGDEVIAEFPAPLCGILSLKPMETVREEVKKLEESLKREWSGMGKTYPHHRYPWNTCDSAPENYPPRLRQIKGQKDPSSCNVDIDVKIKSPHSPFC